MSFTDDTRAPAATPADHGVPARVQPGHTQPYPELPHDPVVWEQLIAQRAVTKHMADQHERMLHALTRPAQMIPIQLTAANAVQEDRERYELPTLSVGLLNPAGSPGNVNLGVIGSATAADAISVAPGKLLVLPISAQQIEVGTSFALGAGQVLFCYLLRFFTVQAAYLGG
jgi:hypothetical protein